MKFFRRHPDREAASAMPTSASAKLAAEVRRLSDVIDDIKFQKEVTSLGLDAIKLLASQDTPSANPQIRAIIRRSEEKHSQVIAKGGSLSNGFGELLQECRKDQDFYIARWQEVLARNSRVDAQKIANEELLDLLTRARQTMESAPEDIGVLVDSAAIANFSQFFYYADLLNALLQYPTKYRRVLDVAGDLAKAAVMDLAGTAVPFLGTITTAIDTVFDLMEPRIEKKIEELRRATTDFNRVADFGDQLTELLGYADFTQEVIRNASRTLKTNRASFTTDAAWLSAVLGNAERA
jgi:hypothetical protein